MTNLFNKNMRNYTPAQFYTLMRKVLVSAVPNEYVFVSLDFDNFKYVNDLFGYEFGDRALISITNHFSDQLNEGELFSRLNADQFIFLIKAMDKDALIERFLKMVDVKNCLSSLLPEHYNFVASGGLFYIDNPKEKTSNILDKANFARKQAKGNHVSTILHYNKIMSNELKWKKEITLSMDRALKDQEFEMYLQPKILIKHNSVVGAEALVRWKNKKHGMIFPDQFIPVLEQNGFIKLLDFYMLEQACIFLKKCVTNNTHVLPISVNFSKVNISSPSFVEDIFKIVTKYELSTKLIEVELTESVFSQDFITLVSISEELSSLGFRVSLDDFGSAYSSLSYLKNFPVDTIKIDKGFLNNSTNSNKGKLIIAKIIEMIKDLHLTAVVEGVENQSQVDFLKKLGCEICQGYFYARPMPVSDYEEFLLKNPIENIEVIEAARITDDMYGVPKEFEMDNWELYVLGKNIDMGLMKGYLDSEDVIIQYVNQRALNYLGYTAEEFSKVFHNKLSAFVHPDDISSVKSNTAELVQTGLPVNFKTRVLNKNGQVVYLAGRISCVFDEHKRPVGIYAFQDITESLNNTSSLQNSLQTKINELELLYSIIPEGAVQCKVDENLTLLYYNNVFLKLIGYNKKELANIFDNKLMNIILPEDRQLFMNSILEHSISGSNTEIAFRMKHKSGKILHVIQKGKIVETEDAVQCLYCVFVDITSAQLQ